MADDDLKDVRAILAMHEDLDDLIEQSLQRRHGLAQFMSVMLPLVAERLGASGMTLQTYGESLDLETFTYGDAIPVSGFADRTGEGSNGYATLDVGGRTVLAQRLDVAGEWFGRAAAAFAQKDIDGDKIARLLDAACEELDNFLYAIRAARQKHMVMMRLGDALRSRVLADGLQQAVDVLVEAIPMDRMLLVYVAEESNVSTLHVQLFEGNKATLDTLKGTVDPAILDEGRKYLRGESAALLERLGFSSAQEEVLINGVTHSVVVGKVVTSKGGAFNTWDRELLAGFAGFVRQRIVDFNKEWRRLAASFRAEDVARLVQADDYEARYLTPREETVAILYVDISGFTRISEQVLKTPKKVAHLVEQWSERAVDLVWKHGGVFDKMVGDCIIALFGPPFYEREKGERLADAIQCAIDIRAMTASLPEMDGFEELREGGIGVSTGVNLAPLMVGSFGKNSNFTGFSSGMNNTARLQGCAKKDEILVMAESIPELPRGRFSFSEEQSAQVKNVAVPLRFRCLVG